MRQGDRSFLVNMPDVYISLKAASEKLRQDFYGSEEDLLSIRSFFNTTFEILGQIGNLPSTIADACLTGYFLPKNWASAIGKAIQTNV